MAYCIDKAVEKQRGKALKEIFYEHRSVAQVARRYGRNRSTIYRWLEKWRELNNYPDFNNYGRPRRLQGATFRLSSLKWLVPTLSSAPKVHPNALDERLVARIIATKLELGRSNLVVWLALQNENTEVSFSSVRRIVRRYKLQRVRLYGKKYWAKHNPRKPKAESPGDLVEVDTVFLMNHFGGRDLYITNIIDVHTRLAHSYVDYSYSQTSTANAVLAAQKEFGFKFKMVQCDNGREFGQRFKDILAKHNIPIRHTRVRQPNDNAHIERFNRTMRDESIGPYTARTLPEVTKSIQEYLIYYNYVRIHTTLRMTPMQVLQRC